MDYSIERKMLRNYIREIRMELLGYTLLGGFLCVSAIREMLWEKYFDIHTDFWGNQVYNPGKVMIGFLLLLIGILCLFAAFMKAFGIVIDWFVPKCYFLENIQTCEYTKGFFWKYYKIFYGKECNKTDVKKLIVCTKMKDSNDNKKIDMLTENRAINSCTIGYLRFTKLVVEITGCSAH